MGLFLKTFRTITEIFLVIQMLYDLVLLCCFVYVYLFGNWIEGVTQGTLRQSGEFVDY